MHPLEHSQKSGLAALGPPDQFWMPRNLGQQNWSGQTDLHFFITGHTTHYQVY